jgi:hypothetical protein
MITNIVVSKSITNLFHVKSLWFLLNNFCVLWSYAIFITLNHNQQHQLSEVAFKTLHDLLRRHDHTCRIKNIVIEKENAELKIITIFSRNSLSCTCTKSLYKMQFKDYLYTYMFWWQLHETIELFQKCLLHVS